MFSSRNPFGLRLALWYAAVFSISSLVIILLAYALTARSLAARDHKILQSKVGEYAAAYARGGIPALTTVVRSEQAVTPERLLGRVTAATRFVGWGVAPPAALAAGLLADAIGLRPTLFACAVIAAVAFVYLLASPVRRYRRPEAEPVVS